MYNQRKSKDNYILIHHNKNQVTQSQVNKIDQSIDAAELFNDKLKGMGYDISGVVIAALQNLSKPFKEYAKMPVPLRRIQNGEFVGFITGSIIYDL